MPLIDVTGQRFGRLVAVCYEGYKPGGSMWRVRCDCGTERVVRLPNLKRGATKSCGCLNQELKYARNRTHGGTAGTKDPIFNLWSRIKGRCNNSKNKDYPDYGGRGIKVCAEWESDFSEFRRYVGNLPKPEGKVSLDRVDNSRGYQPGNVRWATDTQQARNKRNNRVLKFQGLEMSLPEAAEKFGLSQSNLRSRLRLGWPLEDALGIPVLPHGQNYRSLPIRFK